ncbi:MAG: hypothetical protein M1814_004104 [Vezdaea aestivalis]|nr:MAG: hypothetical protein M1814_004104 [Vezdaea aestivalis]
MSVPREQDGLPYYNPSDLRRSHSSQSIFLNSKPFSTTSEKSHPHSAFTSPISKHPGTQILHQERSDRSSFSSSSSSTLSFDTRSEQEQQEEEDQIVFPSYDDVGYFDQSEDLDVPPSPSNGESFTVSTISNSASTTSTHSRPGSPRLLRPEDDLDIKREPTRHVDYLSHEWREEDIWSSWRLIVSNRNHYGNSARLENASWRSWAKAKHSLRTISPETLNWLKDCDVTWLYGPLQTCKHNLLDRSPPDSRLSRTNSSIFKKPILKKRSASELMLQRSLSNSSLLAQATAALRAQQNNSDRPFVPRAISDFVTYPFPSAVGSEQSSNTVPSNNSSGLQTPGIERRHIHFNDKVEQCIAVDIKGTDDDEDTNSNPVEDDSESDDGVIMMKMSNRSKGRASGCSTPRNSFSTDNRTIAMLPSTTLKYRGDTPEPPAIKSHPSTSFWANNKLISPSPSVETLRPAKPSRNFLLNPLNDEEDEDEMNLGWEPSNTIPPRRENLGGKRPDLEQTQLGEDQSRLSEGLRRTPSGMFMPIEEDEDDVVAAGLFGKAVDTVNTFKDIAHVIWNVGWRR